MRTLLTLALLALSGPANAAATLVLERTQKVTLDASAGDIEIITVPIGTRWVWVRFEAADGFIDWPLPAIAESAAKSANAFTFDSDTWFVLRAPGSGSGRSSLRSAISLHIAHTNSSGVVQLLATADGGD